MGTNLITVDQVAALPEHVDPQTVATMTRSWPDLAKRHLTSKEERDLTALAIQKISTPATPRAIAAKVVPILSEYFVALDRAGVSEQVGEIWQDELAPYPLWSIHKACRWWLSKDNANRRRKPLPGDISERCEVEMMLVRIAQRRVDHFDQHGPPPKESEAAPSEPMTDEQRAEFERTLARFTRGRQMPKPQSEAETQRNIQEVQRMAAEGE